MDGVFLFLYSLFRKKRRLLFAILVLLTALAAFLASKIRFEEDITKMIYGGEGDDIVKQVVEQSKFLDKIIINVRSEDTINPPETSEIIKTADRLNDSLRSKAFEPYVAGLTYEIPDTMTRELFDIVYSGLPVFLEDPDYEQLDSIILERTAVREMIGDVYRNLLSPASFVLKEMLIRDPAGISSRALARLGAYQNDENYVIVDGRIFSRDRRNLLMFITPSYPSSATSENADFVKELDHVIRKILVESGPDMDIEYFGTVVVAAANAERLKKDIRLTVTITLILLSLIINFSIKRKKLFPFIFFPAIFGGLMGLAVIFLVQGKISVISMSIGTVILAITVDYALHITTHFKHKHSVINTIKDVSFPIIVCGFATAFEFLALLFVSSESLNELGMLAAISVITAAFFTMVVMPHIFEVTKSESDETEEKNFLERILDRITNYNFHKNRLLLGFMVLYTLIALFYMRKVGFESDMMKMNYVTPALAEAEEHLNDINSYKLNSIYVVAYGTDLQDALVHNERVLNQAEALKARGRISGISSPGSVLLSDSLQMQKLNRWYGFWTEEKKQTFLGYLEDEAVRKGFKPGSFHEFHNLINKDFTLLDPAVFKRLEAMFYVDNISSADGLTSIITTLKVDDTNKESITRMFSEFGGVFVIDRKSMLSGIVDTLGEDFNTIANVSLLLILAVLILAFGRIELGFITFIPILISWVWTLGFMGMAGIKFNIFNIIISSFITGLGIDYSIYIMQGLVQGYKTENTNLLSYKTCILISVMISLAGTGVMILAKHPALHSIALISIVGLLSVVLISYTFEPVLFYWLVSKKEQKRVAPVTLSDLFFTFIGFTIAIAGSLLLNVIFLMLFILPFPTAKKKYLLHRFMAFFCKLPVYAMPHVAKKIINKGNEDFSQPSVMISNHQSHIDLLLLLMLHPKIIVLTNKWVWNNPVYALVIRYLDYYPVTKGYDAIIDKLKMRADEGYSILVFPEGTRSNDSRIRRFHKGAFLLAEKLGLDILPVMIHGAGECMTKGENHLRGGSVRLTIYPRLKADDPSFGKDYHARTKSMLAFYRKEYQNLREELETPSYFRKKLIRNYIYKGPVLEWYTRIKLSMEKNYALYDRFIPREASIVDIGCGYGMMSYMLSFVSDKRMILGIDYDEDKIGLAGNCISRHDRIQFVAADAVHYPLPGSDVYILSDVLHYIPEEQQEKLLVKCFENLNPGGMIMIRDADKDLRKRHLVTRYTEFFSTRFRFNKTRDNRLYFISGKKILALAEQFNMKAEVIDNTRLTSNLIYILRPGIAGSQEGR
ncbi:MAG: 1-acyl-sn-glycerol-3-phosphate acyltransferase [Bacteroidales bacterium]|nr:1-acyl-sn-glycerol-3-phosphate acyltransferase [Bacteroidales bacterium]